MGDYRPILSNGFRVFRQSTRHPRIVEYYNRPLTTELYAEALALFAAHDAASAPKGIKMLPQTSTAELLSEADALRSALAAAEAAKEKAEGEAGAMREALADAVATADTDGGLHSIACGAASLNECSCWIERARAALSPSAGERVAGMLKAAEALVEALKTCIAIVVPHRSDREAWIAEVARAALRVWLDARGR